jgi:hypothetical protein
MTLFQTLDDKSECVGLYINKELQFNVDEIPSGLTKTWKYVPYLKGQDIDYVSLYLEGAPLKSALPEYLLEDWEDISSKLAAFKRSLSIAGVSLGENCFYDLVPKRFLIEYCELQNKITDHIEESIPQPSRYQYYKFVHVLLRDLEEHRVNIDHKFISSFLDSPRLKNYASRILDGSRYVRYNQFGTKTGRLTCTSDSFPILTLPAELRGGIVPENDYFLEIDFNGAEIRTLLGLLGKHQPDGDIHEYNMKKVFQGSLTRERAKTAFFAWLYGSRTAVSSDERQRLAKFYNSEEVVKKYWDGKTVKTPYGKVIPDTSQHHALNYIIQSTTAELVIKQALKIKYLLENRGATTQIAFMVHDSIVLDVKKEDSALIRDIVTLFGNTNFGRYKVNLKRGKTLGSLTGVQM